MNKIIINRGSFKLDEVDFQQNSLSIGRSADNDIPLDDSAVSGHHAKIITVFRSFYIEDLDSTNGTLVNGKPIVKHTLHSGDVIAVGNHQLLFQSDEPASKAPEDDTLVLQQGAVKERLNEYMQTQPQESNQPASTNNAAGNREKIPPSTVSMSAPGIAPRPQQPGNSDVAIAPANLQAEKALNSVQSSMEAGEGDLKVHLPEGPGKVGGGQNHSTVSAEKLKSDAKPKVNTLGKISEKPDSAIGRSPTQLGGDTSQPNDSRNSATDPDAAYLNKMRDIPDYLVNPKKKKSNIKAILPIIWAVIVAVLVIEIVYITYRSLS